MVLGLALWAAGGCYHHDRSTPVAGSAARGAASGSRLRAAPFGPARTGVYDVTGPEGQRGRERFTVTATAGRWALRSRRVMPHGEEGFALALDRVTAEPVSFEAWRRFEDLEQSVRGRREGDWFVLRHEGLAAGVRRIAYAPGTLIDAPTPTFKAAALALLRAAIRDAESTVVRTIRIDGPFWASRVVLSTFEHRGRSGTLDLVRLTRAGERPAGLWVRADGWPVRMRVLGADRRPAWQWRLRTSTATVPADESAPE